jgi:hypothetical protein
MNDTIFKYKLDFYYQQTLVYLMTLVLYAGIRGSFIEGQFSVVFKDPIVYIIVLFFVVSLTVLLLNLWRGRRLIVTEDHLVFQARRRERIFRIADIEWMHIGKERMVQTAGRFQQISIKIKNRPMVLRIRAGRYERSRELVAAMEALAKRVPGKLPRRFRFNGKNAPSILFQRKRS